ncbi:unnamed protein product [Effrenium voratum]|nr:unnamed protein product [Effrenium voratum]
MDLGVARPVPLDITVLLPMALPAAAQSFGAKEREAQPFNSPWEVKIKQTSTDACFRKKASQGGCAGPHSLRAMYMTAWQVPGYQRTLDLPDLTRRGFWPPPDPPIEEAVYVPHNDVFSSFLSRWVQMHLGSNGQGVSKQLGTFWESKETPTHGSPFRGLCDSVPGTKEYD